MMDGAPGRILVVEDDGVEREGIVELLRLWGYDAQPACDGLEALRELKASPFDLVLSDLEMPHMSGEELLKELRRQSVTCVIISGKENKFDKARELGASAFLEKPVCAELLKSAVAAGLGARQSDGVPTPPQASIEAPRHTW